MKTRKIKQPLKPIQIILNNLLDSEKTIKGYKSTCPVSDKKDNLTITENEKGDAVLPARLSANVPLSQK